jgi:hypothetical protein
MLSIKSAAAATFSVENNNWAGFFIRFISSGMHLQEV